jgi:hypothetical protein
MLHRRDQNLVPTKATTETAPQRLLQKNLRKAVEHLSDGELDLMHAATLEEIKRRGKMPPSVETDLRSFGRPFNNQKPHPPEPPTPCWGFSFWGPQVAT